MSNYIRHVYQLRDYNEVMPEYPGPEQSFIVASVLTQFSKPIKPHHFAIKYVLQGCEKYMINGRRYDVFEGEYLLMNQFAEGNVCVNSVANVKGVCVNININLLSEIAATAIDPRTSSPDLGLVNFFTTPDFLENKYKAADSNVKNLLNVPHLFSSVINENKISRELFFEITETIVKEHFPIMQQIYSIHVLRRNTRKELYLKIRQGKEYIDQFFLKSPEISVVAKESGISQYQFFRLFKSVYNESPYQYMTRKKLEYGYSLLKMKRVSVSDAALECGFADIFSFSKAFKKHFHISPSLI